MKPDPDAWVRKVCGARKLRPLGPVGPSKRRKNSRNGAGISGIAWGRIPRSLNESASAEARARWPEATSFRCESPDQLARFLFERGLVRGCDIEADDNLLHVRWHDPERFYSQGRFHQLLLESGVRIFEVQSTESLLEKATGHAQET